MPLDGANPAARHRGSGSCAFDRAQLRAQRSRSGNDLLLVPAESRPAILSLRLSVPAHRHVQRLGARILARGIQQTHSVRPAHPDQSQHRHLAANRAPLQISVVRLPLRLQSAAAHDYRRRIERRANRGGARRGLRSAAPEIRRGNPDRPQGQARKQALGPRPPNMKLPNFIIAGGQRCSSTWLWTLCNQHPDIFMAQSWKPEPKFFSADYHLGLAHYARYFGASRGEPVIGEKSVTYLTHPIAAQRIAADLPGAKIVFVLRNPIERAFSHWCYTTANLLEALPLRDALIMEPWRERRATGAMGGARPRSH